MLQAPEAEFRHTDTSTPDKSEFASLVHKEYSKSTDHISRKKEHHSKSAVEEDDISNNDASACIDCTTDNNKTSQNTIGNNEQQGRDDIELVNGDEEQTDDEVAPGDGLKTGALLFSLVHGYMVETGNVLQGSTGDGASDTVDIGAGDPDGETAPENGLKVGDLLHDVVSRYAAEIGVDMNPVPEAVQDSGSEDADVSGLSAGNGLKVGTVLNNLVSSYRAEIEGEMNPVPESAQDTGLKDAEASDISAGNGVKAGTMVNNLARSNSLEIEEASPANSENEEGIDPGKKVSASPDNNGLKEGESANRPGDRSDAGEIKKEMLKEEIAVSVKTADTSGDADGTEAARADFKKEVTGQAETKNGVSGHVVKNHSEDIVVDVKMPGKNTLEGLQNSMTSGSSDQFGRENGTGEHAFKFLKGLNNSGNDSETNNVNSINTSNNTFESARSVQGPAALHTAKTPGFQELIDNVVYVIKGNSKMGVSIENEDLGKLNISLSLEKGLVNVHIHTADKAVRELLENNIQHIVDTLNKDGVSVGEFSVGLRDQRGHETGNFSLKNGQGRGIPQEIKKEHRHNGIVNIFA